jgi:hypothetical protein
MTSCRLLYGEPDAISSAIDYAEHRSRSHDAVIRVYDEAGNVIKSPGNAMAAQLKEQAAQIQKVSTKVEASKPAPQLVNNNQ